MKQKFAPLFLPLILSSLVLATFFVWVEPATAVDHTVGGACGATIQACINFAAPNDTVIIPDGTYNENVVLNKPVSLQGTSTAGTIIDAGGSGRGVFITGTTILSDTVIENLTITNGDVSGGNVCSGLTDVTNCGGGVVIAGGAYPTLQNLLISDNAAHDGGGLFVERDSGVLVDTVEFANNFATQVGGGAVFNDEVTIINSRFVQNRSQNAGGGASIAATFPNYPKFQVMISGTEFISNTAACSTFMCFLHGGGLRIFELEAEIVNSRFENNRCSAESGTCTGGGLSHSQAFNLTGLTLRNTDFISNSAQSNGGGVSSNLTFSDTVRVFGGRFISNTLVITAPGPFDGEGGGLYVRDAATEISGTQFVSNTAVRLGGGFYALGLAEITSAQFQSNQVITGSGGGLAVDFVGTLTMTDTELVSNTASLNGGGLYATVPTVITGGRFAENQSFGGDAQGDFEGGGAIYATQPLTVTNVDFVSNIAFLNGGGIFMPDSQPLLITGGRFENNEAQGQASPFAHGGGGIFVVGDVQAAGTVFISNTAVLTNSFNDNNNGGAGYVFGAAVFDQVQVQNNSSYGSGGGFFVDGEATLTDSNFVGNQAVSFAGGGLATDQPATVTGGSFTNNSAGFGGGGVSIIAGLDAGQMTISGVVFDDNTAATSGGGLYLTGEVTVTINSVDFQNNQVTSGSGGGATISTIFGSQTSLTGVDFINNTAAIAGGGLSFGQGTINGGTISQNSAAAGGGIDASGLIIINGTQILNNTATGDGGGINSNSNVLITNGLIQDNQSTAGSGGGVWGNSAVVMTDTQVLSNTAALDGGGAYARLGFNTAVTRVLFDSNTAGNAGGGLFVGRRLELSRDTRFLNNTAQLGGGLAISNTSGTTGMDLINNLFSRNTAVGSGAAVYVQTPRPLRIWHTTIADVSLNGSEAVYVLSSTVGITNSIIVNHAVGLANVTGAVSSDFNVYFGNSVNESGTINSTNVIVGDPMFVNPAGDDYRLVLGSAALDNALDVGITADILGLARPVDAAPDRGAFEGSHTPTAVALQTAAGRPVLPPASYLILFLLLLLATMAGWRLNHRRGAFKISQTD